jgi:hypothetical protein
VRESTVWNYIERNAPSWLSVERLEVKYPPGLSDCFWHDRRSNRTGWLELKFCRADDKELRAGRIPKLSKEQPLFMTRWARRGVPCGLLLRVESDKWLFWKATGDPAWSNMINSTEAIRSPLALWGYGSFDLTEVFDLLSSGVF